jgi:hypothetical protein
MMQRDDKENIFFFFLFFFLLLRKHLFAGRMARIVEHLPSKCEAWSSNPSTGRKEGRNIRRGKKGSLGPEPRITYCLHIFGTG